jgi:HTH-type transcriptional regulator/antitoxin HigA
MIVLLNGYLGIPLESLIVGNNSAKLRPDKRKKVLSVPSIENYFESTHGV